MCNFLMIVRGSLKQQGAGSALTPKERDLCALAQHHGVGPYDCAAQIISDRADATGLTVQPKPKAVMVHFLDANELDTMQVQEVAASAGATSRHSPNLPVLVRHKGRAYTVGHGFVEHVRLPDGRTVLAYAIDTDC